MALDLTVLDSGGSRRRLQMSSSQREVAVTPLNARVPLTALTGEVGLCTCSSLIEYTCRHKTYYEIVNFFFSLSG